MRLRGGRPVSAYLSSTMRLVKRGVLDDIFMILPLLVNGHCRVSVALLTTRGLSMDPQKKDSAAQTSRKVGIF